MNNLNIVIEFMFIHSMLSSDTHDIKEGFYIYLLYISFDHDVILYTVFVLSNRFETYLKTLNLYLIICILYIVLQQILFFNYSSVVMLDVVRLICVLLLKYVKIPILNFDK